MTSTSGGGLGDRMKRYEQAEAGRRLMPRLPVCARLDGRGFTAWTAQLQRPYDPGFREAMIATAVHLVAETGARVGYTQSDEINLVWYEPARDLMLFGGKFQKLTSILASMTTGFFNQSVFGLAGRGSAPAQFDCRVWNVPTTGEAANFLLWREQDATKNSISAAAREFYSHEELLEKTSGQMQEMLFARGVNWNDYPVSFKRGIFVRASGPLALPPLATIADRVTTLFPPPKEG